MQVAAEARQRLHLGQPVQPPGDVAAHGDAASRRGERRRAGPRASGRSPPRAAGSAAARRARPGARAGASRCSGQRRCSELRSRARSSGEENGSCSSRRRARASRSAPRWPSSSPSKLAAMPRRAATSIAAGTRRASQGTSPGSQIHRGQHHHQRPDQRHHRRERAHPAHRVHGGRGLGPGDERPRRDPGVAAEPPLDREVTPEAGPAGELHDLALPMPHLVRRGRRREPVREALLAVGGGRLVEELEERAVPEDVQVGRVRMLGERARAGGPPGDGCARRRSAAPPRAGGRPPPRAPAPPPGAAARATGRGRRSRGPRPGPAGSPRAAAGGTR